jgi:hypothetical protein
LRLAATGSWWTQLQAAPSQWLNGGLVGAQIPRQLEADIDAAGLMIFSAIGLSRISIHFSVISFGFRFFP